MNRLTLRALSCVALLGGLVAVPVTANGQEIIRHVYHNSTNVRAFVHDVERESNSFRELFEKRYHNMFISNFRRSDRVRKAIQDLDKACEVADRKAEFNKPKYARDEVSRIVDKARVVDHMFTDPDQVLATMKPDWADLREAINALAQTYELPDIDG